MLTNEQIENLTDEQRVSILDGAIEYILDHPENWNQDDWHCATGFCLAGIIAETYGPGWEATYVGLDQEIVFASDLETGESALRFANRVLGFDVYEFPRMFDGSNTIRDLIDHRNDYADERNLASRKWRETRITKAERIAVGTNAARKEWDDTYEDPRSATQMADDMAWSPYGIETRAYSAEIRRQRRVKKLVLKAHKAAEKAKAKG